MSGATLSTDSMTSPSQDNTTVTVSMTSLSQVNTTVNEPTVTTPSTDAQLHKSAQYPSTWKYHISMTSLSQVNTTVNQPTVTTPSTLSTRTPSSTTVHTTPALA
ncbi:integumentary mucin C.1-like, partial [Candoia aspera]|uniref:integumentary mucin C.1-like n=1 Tax=Candoia aspera TaxID=51853 RepID=UPI002FD87973